MSAINDSPWVQMFPGVKRKTLTTGEKIYQMLVLLDVGGHVPPHRHPQEQVSYVISGRLRFYIEGATFEVGPGESIDIPGDAEHAVDTLEDAVVIDTFSPPRDDYLARDREVAAAGGG